MKKRFIAVFSILTMVLALLATSPVNASLPSRFWALIIAGDFSMTYDTDYLYHVLVEHYPFDPALGEIVYLAGYPNDKETVRSYISDWLVQVSTSNDLVFIFIMSHGVGYNAEEEKLYGPEDAVDGSRGDLMDEEEEHYYEGEQVGIDEAIQICMYKQAVPEYYWDDEFRDDLTYVSCSRLIVFYHGCKSENSSDGCFSGGFIRDLSAPGRIIITCSNETEFGYVEYLPWREAYYGCFSRPFIDALNPEGYYELNDDGTAIVDPETGEPVWIDSYNNADTYSYMRHDVVYKDGKVSIWEAFQYAWLNDEARIDGDTHPQLDDNGDGVADDKDGSLSVGTYFGSDPIKRTDVNHDGVVDGEDIACIGICWQSTAGEKGFDAYVDLNNDGRINIRDAARMGKDFGKSFEV